MDVFITSDAEHDVEDIVTYVEAQETPERADALYEKIKAAISRLATMPNRGRIVPELKEIGVNEYREVVLKPYRVLYFTEANHRVFVFAIFDGRRNLDELLQRRVLGIR
jgi:toxin ParE1/3/4